MLKLCFLAFFFCLTGSRSFGRKSLHHIGNGHNPYEQAISIIGKTLSAFDEDNLIPCYGFGDGNWMHSFVSSIISMLFGPLEWYVFLFILVASTHDKDVFSFYPEDCVCTGFEEVLTRYREIVPTLRLAGAAVPPLTIPLGIGQCMVIRKSVNLFFTVFTFLLQDLHLLHPLLRWQWLLSSKAEANTMFCWSSPMVR